MKGFIVDTDKYAGNFEREMCAVVMNAIGDCGVGDNLINTWDEEDLSGYTRQVNDEGCYRPVEIYPSPYYYNNGMGFHYKDTPEGRKEALEKYKQSWVDYNTPHIERAKRNLVAEKPDHPSWTPEACKGEIKRLKDEIEKAMSSTEPHKYSAYNSVLFHLDKELPQKVIDKIKYRCEDFVKHKGIKIIGYRVLDQGGYINKELKQIKDSLYYMKHMSEQDLYSEDICTVTCAEEQLLLVAKMVEIRAGIALYN